MNLHRFFLFAILAAGVGCVTHTEDTPTNAAPPQAEEPKGEIKQVKIGPKGIVLEIEKRGDKEIRRVRMEAEVCFREGMLEHLVTRNRIKDHEAILTTEIDARHLHTALTLAGAEAGKVVQFRPKLVAPSGTTIKVFLEYKKDGKLVRVPAQQWIRNFKTKKDFHTDWVFAGSKFNADQLDKNKQPYYLANDGDVITVVNFEGACLDVPFLATKDNADLDFEAHTERIPALKTAVTVILEPVPKKKD
ncbi:MAG: hypothetical protein HY289_11230 [Planctomycetes bacterium]|nr:hypothetical protein [Planctomycetota bacterium]